MRPLIASGFADGKSFHRAIGDELDRLMRLALDLIEKKVDVLKLAECLRSERVVSGERLEKVLAYGGVVRNRTPAGKATTNTDLSLPVHRA